MVEQNSESRDELRAREHTRTYAMAAMTGAEFRRRDACQAHAAPWYRPPWVRAVGRAERSTSVTRKRRRGRENERGEVES